MVKYLIVVEIDRRGYILELVDDLDAGQRIIEDIFDISEVYTIYEMDKVAERLPYPCTATYEIKGNELYVGKGGTSTSNGVLTVTAVEIDTETFCLESFIRERENHSMVFGDCDDSKYEKLLELFPHVDLCAN